MTPEELLRVTRRQLKQAAEPGFAAGVRRFFREPVDPYGVRSPQLKQIARALYREVKRRSKPERDRLMTALWKSGKLEEGALVCYVLKPLAKEFGERDFQMFDGWLDRYVRNWAHCDGLSSWLLAGAIRNRPGLIRRLPAWTKSKNRWRRRAAAVSLIQEAKAGRNTQAVFRICSLLRRDADDMVQKGVGWLLKETYPRRPRDVRRFRADWRATAPRLVLRIAAEKMTARDRKWLLGK